MKNFILYIFLCFLSFGLYGQSQPEFESFQAFDAGDLVDPATGSFSYNIPLFEVLINSLIKFFACARFFRYWKTEALIKKSTVLLLNFILEIESPNDDQIWLSDINSDSTLNILDIIALVNIILN